MIGVLSEDPLFPTRTRAWAKQHLGGLYCAYCWHAKRHLHADKDMGALKDLVAVDQIERKKFFDFITWMIEQRRDGLYISAALYRPQETVTQECSSGLNKKVRGVMKLKDAYIAQHGDPATNNLGHTVMRTLWKTNTMEDVVLIPQTEDDEMECSWFMGSQTNHSEQVADSTCMQEDDQAKNIYRRMRGRHMSRLTGERLIEAQAPSTPSMRVPSPQASPRSNVSGGRPLTESGSSSSGPHDVDMLDLMGEHGSRMQGKALPANPVTPAKQKAKSKAGQKAKGNMPAPLPKPSAKKGAATTTCSPLKTPACDLLIEKANRETEQFAALSQEVIKHAKDKAWYKMMLGLQTQLNLAMGSCHGETQKQCTLLRKALNVMVMQVKDYKAWLRGGIQDFEYCTKLEEMTEFMSQDPTITLDMPACMTSDHMELMFGFRMVPIVHNRKLDSLLLKFKGIASDKLLTVIVSEEVPNFQRRCVETTLFGLFRHRDMKRDHVLDELIEDVVCFLSPFPNQTSLVAGMSFHLDAELSVETVELKEIFVHEDPQACADKILALGESKKPMHSALKSHAVGSKLVARRQAVLQVQLQRKASGTRVLCIFEELHKLSARETAEAAGTIMALDAELSDKEILKYILAKESAVADFERFFDKWLESLGASVTLDLKHADEDTEQLKGRFASDTGRLQKQDCERRRFLTSARQMNLLKSDFPYTDGQAKLRLSAIDLVNALLDGPAVMLQLTPEQFGDTVPAGMYESLAVMVSDLLCQKEEAVVRSGLGVEQVVQWGRMGDLHLAKGRGTCLNPRILKLVGHVYFDKCFFCVSKGSLMCNEFVTEPALQDLAREAPQWLEKDKMLAAAFEEVHVFCLAYKCEALFVMLSTHHVLGRLRFAYSRLQLSAKRYKGEWLGIETNDVADFRTLESSVHQLQLWLKQEHHGKAAADFEKMAERERMGVLLFPFSSIKVVMELAIKTSEALLEELLGAWMSRLHKDGQSLSAAIPAWERFVVTQWDEGEVKSMLEKQWTHVAKQWKFLDTVSKDVTSVFGAERLNGSYPSTVKIVEEALDYGKKFIGAVSICDLILQQLPSLGKVARAAKITEFFTKATTSGAHLPDNLVAFLQAEQRRSTKP